MMCMNILSEMQLEMRTVLEDNILSFWEDKMTDSMAASPGLVSWNRRL